MFPTAYNNEHGSDDLPLFWVPDSCRQALTGIETLVVCGRNTTRLNLSQFVYGKLWQQCYFPSDTNVCSSPLSSLLIGSGPVIPQSPSPGHCIQSHKPTPFEQVNSKVNPILNANPDGLSVEAKCSHIESTEDDFLGFTSNSDYSESSYLHYILHVTSVLVLLIAIYCFYTIGSHR
jgi:hypothetical protein